MVKSLRVMLCPDGPSWFAQGLEIDYAAAGASIDEAKSNFEDGLALTIQEHLTLHGNITCLLKLAPKESWDEFLTAAPSTLRMSFSTVEGYDKVTTTPALQDIPFNRIMFIEAYEGRCRGLTMKAFGGSNPIAWRVRLRDLAA